MRHKQEVFPAVNAAIIDRAHWNCAQVLLGRNQRAAGTLLGNRHGALLRGLADGLFIETLQAAQERVGNSNRI